MEDLKIKIVEIGPVCVYCGAETSEPCCGEIHHELGYETEDGELILYSELTSQYEIE